MTRLWGIWGRPYVDLAPHVDTTCFPALDAEICRALSRVPAGQTGGSLQHMGVVAPWFVDGGYGAYVDYGRLIGSLPADEWRMFVSLADDPTRFVEDARDTYGFGDETDHPLSAQQIRWLTYRHGVYFPWKVCVHLLENDRWDDKHSGAGKAFTDEALREFPQTVAFIRTLPFTEIGRVVLFGLHAHDHAPAHRDTEPGEALQVAQSINFCPRGDKRFYLAVDGDSAPVVVDTPIYWFNDMDWHGVLADPRFRYSIRVDGVFDPAWVRHLERAHRR